MPKRIEWSSLTPKERKTSIIGLVILVLIVIGGAGSLAGSSRKVDFGATSNPADTAASQPATTPTAQAPVDQHPHFTDGTYKVGTDIQPGTYRTRTASPGCYYARLADFTGGVDSILANGNTDAPEVVTILPTDTGFTSERCGTWTQDLSAITASQTTFTDGTYFVGTDIQPGTYRSSGQTGCYWARLSDFTGGTDSILANDNTDTPAIVTILATDKGFHATRCGTWTLE